MHLSENSLFTVYQTKSAIELHAGCDDYHNYRVICTCISYENAYEAAQLSADLKQLPIVDFVGENRSDSKAGSAEDDP